MLKVAPLDACPEPFKTTFVVMMATNVVYVNLFSRLNCLLARLHSSLMKDMTQGKGI